MDQQNTNYWLRQSDQKALFEDIIWSQPENLTFAGRLFILGGNVHGFSAPAKAYESSLKAGIGSIRLILPDSLRKTIGRILIEAEYVNSTPSGSLANKSLAEILDYAAWADLSLLPGDNGRNSETSMLMEAFLREYKQPICLTKDALDTFIQNPEPIVNRPQTLIVASLAQLQKICIKVLPTLAITSSMNLVNLVEALNSLSLKTEAHYVVKYSSNLITAVNGNISTTFLKNDPEIWRVEVASYCSVWWAQNLSKPFESITSGVYKYACQISK